MEQIVSSQGLVSCCSWCHRIKGNDGQWRIISANYLTEMSKKLTHGFCEVCFKEFMKTC